jgi:hypothetical protein
VVGATGFEPATSCSQSKCSSQAELRSDDRAGNIALEGRMRNRQFVFRVKDAVKSRGNQGGTPISVKEHAFFS